MFMDKYQPYREQINIALVRLIELARCRKEIEQETTKLRSLIVANCNLLPDEERVAFLRQAEDAAATGFTSIIRRLFRAAYPGALTTMKIRQELADDGVDLSSQSNPMASIHSIVRRLFEAGEIERYGAADIGAYRWKVTAEDSLLEKFKRGHDKKTLRPQERFSLDHTRPARKPE